MLFLIISSSLSLIFPLIFRTSNGFDFSKIFTGCGGYSLFFDGIDDYVEISASTCEDFNPFSLFTLTYEIWFYMQDYKNPYQWIMGQGGDNGVKFMREGSNNNIALVNSNGSAECFQSMRCMNVPIQKWYHMATSYNGSHFFLYCDGILPEENVLNCTGKGIPGKWDIRMDIGQDHKQPKTRNSFGLFDEMKIWNRSLSLEELNEKRFRTLTKEERQDPSLKLYYTFDQGNGLILHDETLNQNKMINGSLGGFTEFRLGYVPKWIASTSPITGSFCVIDAKFGNNEYKSEIKVYLLEENGLTSIMNLDKYNISVIITELPDQGLLYFDGNLINSIPYIVKSLSFSYISPKSSLKMKNSTSNFTYCLSNINESFLLCNYFLISITSNFVPFSGTSGYCFSFDGIDDYLFSESFIWPGLNYSKGFGGGPVTMEWWGLNTDTDFQIDNLLASGSSVFSVGSSDVVDGSWCSDHCNGRFQAHVPWVDGYLSWDYGWVPGVKGRTTKVMSSYFSKWTHYVLVSEGRNGTFQGIYLDGQIFLTYDSDHPDANALPSDGTNDTLHGLFIGCWPYWHYFFRGHIDEFRIWNRTLSIEEIQATQYKKLEGVNANLYAYYNFNEIFDDNKVFDLSGNNFTLKLGGCSNQTNIYGDKGMCIGDFDSKTLKESYPILSWPASTPFVDDIIYDIFLLENENTTIYLNSTDIDGDQVSLIFLSNMTFTKLFFLNDPVNFNDVLQAQNYYPSQVVLQWSLILTIAENYAGNPLEQFSYVLTDELSNSSQVTVSIYVYCNIGRFLNVSSHRCSNCEAGSYNNDTGKNECILCPIGYFQPIQGSSLCLMCQEGYTTFENGSNFCSYEFQGCYFKSDFMNSEIGIIFNVVMLSMIGVGISMIIFKFNREKHRLKFSNNAITSSISNSTKTNKRIKKPKKSLEDFIEVGSNLMIFFQLLYLCLILDNTKSNSSILVNIIRTFLSITNFNLNIQSIVTMIHITYSEAKIIQLTIYVLIYTFVIISTVLMFLNSKYFPQPISMVKFVWLQKIYTVSLKLSEIFFIPISTSFFKIYSCSYKTQERSSFLDAFCDFECWTSSHIVIITVGSMVFIGFDFFVLTSISEETKEKSKLHFKQNTFFKQMFQLYKLIIGGISVLLVFNKDLTICFLLCMNAIMFLLTFRIKPYGIILRLNIMLRGFFCILLLTCIGSLLDLQTNLNMDYVILPIWFGTIIYLLIAILKSPDVMDNLNNIKQKHSSSLNHNVIFKIPIKTGKN